MDTRNPALRKLVHEVADERTSGWAAQAPGAGSAPPRVPAAPDGVSPWPPAPPATSAGMRVSGVVTASLVMLMLLLAAGWFGWNAVTITTGVNLQGETVVTDTRFPAWLIGSLVVGLVLALITIFKPGVARITAPLYAVAEGLLLGAISHVYESQYEGIVGQAVGLTVAVFTVMLGLYAARIIKPTRKFQVAVFAATGGIMVVYLVSMVLRLLGADVPLIHDNGPVGIGFSLVVVGIAALNLIMDFLTIETLVEQQAPRKYEWYAAFGLFVTLIWLYLELLRLLSKLRSR